MSARITRPMPTQQVSFVCDKCGKKVGCQFAHYDVVECFCGKQYWTLQPHRGGKLVAFPWPGNFLHPSSPGFDATRKAAA